MNAAPDPYAVARYVAHYRRKNGYPPHACEVGCPPDYLDLLSQNGIVDVIAARVLLTEKGQRMAQDIPSGRRGSRRGHPR